MEDVIHTKGAFFVVLLALDIYILLFHSNPNIFSGRLCIKNCNTQKSIIMCVTISTHNFRGLFSSFALEDINTKDVLHERFIRS